MALTDKREDIVDVELPIEQKQRFRLNGDNNKIIELNVHDMGIVNRLDTAYPKLSEIMSRFSTLDTDSDRFKEELDSCDADLREQINYIFDSPVSDVCVSSGRMYDLYDGELAWERVIRTLSKLYADEFASEYKKLKNRVQNRASNYIGRGKNKSKK